MTHHRLSDLLDLTAVKKLVEANYQATGMPIGVVDAQHGSVLVSTGWQDICARFHRANPASAKCCEESDRAISNQLTRGEVRQYKCLNGLWDIAIPIVVDGQHQATLFLGQFFYEGETPDREFFIRQAREFGYDLDSYLAALDHVRVFSRERVDDIVAYNAALAGFIADLAEQALHKLQTDEDLRFANMLLRTQQETSLDGILVVDEAGKIVSHNQRFVDMWQLPPDVIASKSDEQVLRTVIDRLVDPAEFTARVNYLYQHRTEHSHDEFRLKDGLTFERYSAPICGPDEKYYGRVWYVRDVTERKQAEQMLQMFQYTVDQASDAVQWLNRDARFEYVNDEACRSLGYTREELMQLSLWDIDPLYPKARWDRNWAHRQPDNQGDLENLESLHRRKDGSLFPVEVTAKPLRFGDKELHVAVVRDITERKRTEDALRKSQQMLRSALDQFPGVVFWKDRQSVYLGCNQAFSAAAGLAAPEEISGKTDFDLPWATTEAASYRADDSAVINSGQPRLGIIEPQHQGDGRLAWFDTAKVPLIDEAGNVFGVLGTSHDITNQIQTLQALRETEFFLNRSQQVARIGSYKLDVTSGTWISSPSLDDILGIDGCFPKTVDGWLSLILPEDRALMQAHLLQQVLAEHQRFEKEYRILRPRDGQICWVFGLGELEFDAAGQPLRMIGTIQDISERKQAEEDLRRYVERLKTLHQIDQAILAAQSIGAIAEAALARIQRLLPNQRAGVILFDPETDDAVVVAALREGEVTQTGVHFPLHDFEITDALRQGRVQVVDDLTQLSAPSTVEQSMLARGLRSYLDAPLGIKGNLIGALAVESVEAGAFRGERSEIAREIADQLVIAIQQSRLLEQTQRHAAELEQRVADRTSELTAANEQLAAANDRLAELDRLKSKFVSDVSHELRTPIANLKLYADLLERGQPEKHVHYRMVLKQQTLRLSQLVEDILDLSRLEIAGREGLFGPVDLSAVIDQVVTAHQPRAEAAGLTLTFAAADNLPTVRGDIHQLTQVATNLVVNALNYTPQGWVRVAMTAQDGRVAVCVADSGQGIAPEDLPHIFDRFYRGRRARQRDIPGTGLGLAIVKEIVELHHGSITVDSRVGEGTTFCVDLPVNP